MSRRDGTFSALVPPDTYSIRVTANGFQNAESDGVTVTGGQSTALRFALANLTLQTIGRESVNSATAINTTPAANFNVTTQNFIDQDQRQVPNVLDQIPGVEINRFNSNAPGGGTSISVRGAEPYESQILIDGHPVVSSANGAAGFNSTFLNSLLIGGVEVSEGPGSMPNEIEDAVGGTLNFRTPSITAVPSANATIGYDSWTGFYYGLTASDTIGHLGVLVGIAENDTPGYLGSNTQLLGGQISPAITALTAHNPHTGVVNFSYPATQDFDNHAQLAKISYNFTPTTSILFSQFSTQTYTDETGTNFQTADATIARSVGSGTGINYTAPPFVNLIGQTVGINDYAPYPNTYELDNEPIYAGEFRTVIGPGSLLARYYTGTLTRIVSQNYSPVVDPCRTPACPNTDNFNVTPPDYTTYDGEPYVEDTIDILHGFDAQYTLPFGNNNVTFGFDRHVDSATFGEYDPTEGPPTFDQNIVIQSLSYSLRGDFQLTKKLSLESGNYLSTTSYIGHRFDPRDGLVYRVNPNATVRASYGTAFVSPYYSLLNAVPTLSGADLTLPPSSFKPETSVSYDVGTDIRIDRDTKLSFDGYLSTIFNRYASASTQVAGTYNGKPFAEITQEGNQSVAREEGVEINFLRAPVQGLGFHTAVDLLRDYAFDQNPADGQTSVFGSSASGNDVQLPGYPYMKIRNDLFYSFRGGSQVRFSSTSYGENNAFGQAGFTTIDGDVRLPVRNAFVVDLGATNMFNHNNYGVGGVYDGGYTYHELSGGTGYDTLFYTQPRTLFISLQRTVGPGGTSNAGLPAGGPSPKNTIGGTANSR